MAVFPAKLGDGDSGASELRESVFRNRQLESHVAPEGIPVESCRCIDDDTEAVAREKSVDAEEVKRKASSQDAASDNLRREKKNWWFDMAGPGGVTNASADGL